MKKVLLSIALLLALGFGADAQTDVFFTWKEAYDDYDRAMASTMTHLWAAACLCSRH